MFSPRTWRDCRCFGSGVCCRRELLWSSGSQFSLSESVIGCSNSSLRFLSPICVFNGRDRRRPCDVDARVSVERKGLPLRLGAACDMTGTFLLLWFACNGGRLFARIKLMALAAEPLLS